MGFLALIHEAAGLVPKRIGGFVVVQLGVCTGLCTGGRLEATEPESIPAGKPYGFVPNLSGRDFFGEGNEFLFQRALSWLPRVRISRISVTSGMFSRSDAPVI